MAISARELWKRVQRDISGKSNVEQINVLRGHLKEWPTEWKGPYRELQHKLTRLLAKLETAERVKSGTGQRDLFQFDRQGDSQVVLVGLPNSGKSALVSALTSARTAVTDFPFATQAPIPGLLRHRSAAIQVVDTPALVSGTWRGEGAGPRLLNLVRHSDALGIVVDLAEDPQGQIDIILSELEQAKIVASSEPASTLLRQRGKGGITFAGVPIAHDEQDAVRLIFGNAGIEHAEVRIVGAFSRLELDAQIRGLRVVPTLVIGTKCDLSSKSFNAVSKIAGTQFVCIATNFLDEANYEELKDRVFWILGLIRVDLLMKPSPDGPKTSVVLGPGADVADLACLDGAKSPRSARVWGSQVKHQGQSVSLNYLVQPNDAIFIER